ncbi:unnamed protein product, partial [marine sediment metagenome]
MKIISTKRLMGILGCLLALVLTLSLATPALAVPQPPHQFWGEVTIGSQPVPGGTSVEAKIDGIAYASTTTDAQGRYGYTTEQGGTGIFRVPADDPDEPGKDGGANGDTIEFYVADILATTFTFEIGGHNELDLAIEGEIYTLTMGVTGNGTTDPPVGEHTYPAGTVVNITAIHDSG